MLCQQCQIRNATVHMTKIVNDKKEEIHLCEQCAKEKDGLSFESNFSIHNFLASLLAGGSEAPLNVSYAYPDQCPQCGATYDQFRQIGRLGCNICYDTFKSRLIPLTRRIHGNSSHTGKVPKRTGGRIRAKQELSRLKHQLKQLIEREEFENAAKVRDEIKKLENEIQGM